VVLILKIAGSAFGLWSIKLSVTVLVNGPIESRKAGETRKDKMVNGCLG
jgi:hypothetical protein